MNGNMSLHEVIHGQPDPRLPHLHAFLRLLGRPLFGPWLAAAGCMAESVELARNEERRSMARLDAREALQDLITAAVRIIDLTDRNDVMEALRVLAPVSTREPCDVTGFEYVRAIARRAEMAAKAIRSGPGADRLMANLGYPTARMLCAVMVRTAWQRAKYRPPGNTNPKALEACAALWRASGGTPEVARFLATAFRPR